MIDILKLDKTDRKILFELDKNCRISNTKLAKIVRKSREAVKYRIARLIKKGMITGFTASINPNKLGQNLYKIYLKIENIPKKRKEFISYLKENPNIYWLGECEGQWDLIFAFYARSDIEFYNMKNRIISDFSGIIIEKAIARYIDSVQYRKMFLTGEITDSVRFGGEIVNNKIDDVDSLIIKSLSLNARENINEIARKCNTTSVIIKNRMKRLERLGVLIAYRISIDLKKLGLLHFKAFIYLKNISPQDERTLYEYVSRIPNSAYFIRNITPWDIELEFITEGYEAYNVIINKLREDFAYMIRNVETIMMKTDEWIFGHEGLYSR